MFYKKKRNTPEIDDLIVYSNPDMLRRYEWITKSQYQWERKMWIILVSYSVTENKWEFVRYRKWFVRLTNPNVLDVASRAINNRRK